MCLGIVGCIASLAGEHPDLVQVDVAGVVRPVNVVLLERESLHPGDWLLIHAGFAIQPIDEETARTQLALRAYTGDPGPG